MSKFTPGPWESIYTAKGHSTGIVQAKSALVANVRINTGHGSYIVTPEQEANARLISAAPEMIEACRRSIETLQKYGTRERNPDDEAWGAFSQVIAAIAKATGVA